MSRSCLLCALAFFSLLVPPETDLANLRGEALAFTSSAEGFALRRIEKRFLQQWGMAPIPDS